VKLSELGAVVAEEWVDSCRIRQEIVLDEFVAMPNHLHAIVFIVRATGGRPAGRSQDDCPQGDRRSPLRSGPAPRSLSSLVAGFKSAVTRRVRQATSSDQTSVWQRSFYDHVIRGDDDLLRIRGYIRGNPSQ